MAAASGRRGGHKIRSGGHLERAERERSGGTFFSPMIFILIVISGADVGSAAARSSWRLGLEWRF